MKTNPKTKLTREQLARYRETLVALNQRLANELSRMGEAVVATADTVGEHDRAVSESVDKEILLEGNDHALQDQVLDAIRRLDRGQFGVCAQCGKSIAKQRLNALPYTAFCIACERAREAGD